VKLLSGLKNLVFPPERNPRNIVAGPFKGITMGLSLRNETQVYLGLFEKETHPWLMRLSRSLKTAVDIGAANGEYTLFFLMKTEAKTVYAFEPDTSCLPILQENLSLNGIAQTPRLKICTKFVGESESGGKIRLDALADSINSPCLIKMDVDGAEERILKGAMVLNGLPGIRWLIETHSKENEIGCLEILSGAGFQTRIIRNAWWRSFVPELRPIPHNRWLAAWKEE
jgi:hypothetical protein